MSTTALLAKDQRRRRTRAKISGTAERPRLSVHVSNRHIVAQLIDDDAGKTLSFVSTAGSGKVNAAVKGTMTEKATWAGEKIAELAAKKQVKAVVFDRGSRIYHGRLHALAEAARAKGLEL
jgi:large subunit ribosomal protein L18